MADYELIALDEATPQLLAPTSADTGLIVGALDVAKDITGLTLNADGDTSAGDLAVMGYTATEGLILTGQGSTSDVTLKNDADATVLTIPTGTTKVSVETGTLISGVADAADAIGWELDTPAYTTSGAKLLSLKNNTTEQFSVDKAGIIKTVRTTRELYIGTDASHAFVNNPVTAVSIAGDQGVILSSLAPTATAAISQTQGFQFLADAGGCSIEIGRSVIQSFEFRSGALFSDIAPRSFLFTGSPAYGSASTNLTGAAITLVGGLGSSGSSGAAHGGAVNLTGGLGYGTGDGGAININGGAVDDSGAVGNIIMSTLPTSDPSVSGALWNNSGVMTISA